jgi:hypothetical protein
MIFQTEMNGRGLGDSSDDAASSATSGRAASRVHQNGERSSHGLPLILAGAVEHAQRPRNEPTTGPRWSPVADDQTTGGRWQSAAVRRIEKILPHERNR